MQVFGVEGFGAGVRVVRGGVGGGVLFAGCEGGQGAIEGLHVGDVAADAEDCAGVEGAQALDVSETGEGAVGCYRWLWSAWPWEAGFDACAVKLRQQSRESRT